MSKHYHYPSRQELTERLANRDIPKTWTMVSLVLAVLGMGLFLFGAFTGVDRAWHALHFNWLFFATVSTAAIAFAAVQRITTARWSRPVVRFAEGFVAFLPIAFILLLLILTWGQNEIFT